MLSIKEYIHGYFSERQDQLEVHYPGIKVDRILSEFCEFYKLKDSEVYIDVKREFFELLNQGFPLEYIQKNAYFYRSNFFVDQSVLIPRYETEILVEDSIQYIDKHYKEGFKVAEVGTGSFCIGLSIAIDIERPIYIWGGDIDQSALEVSQINLFRLKSKINRKTQIDLVCSDRLDKAVEEFDFIVSNPPYIKIVLDRDGVHEQTNKYEPHIALYLEDDIFIKWFEDFFLEVSGKLKPDGAFFMEGHEDSLEKLKTIAGKYFKKAELKNDYTNRKRFLYAYK